MTSLLLRRGLIVCTSSLLGCAASVPVNNDNSDDVFTIGLSTADHTAVRVGSSLAESDVDVFSCRGASESAEPIDHDAFFPTEPNHRLVFIEPVAGVGVRVTSDVEVVLWIRGESGNFCNAAGTDLITRGSWSAGSYDVFIGSPTQGTVVEYELTVE